ncbi:terminase small subunit [bacterium]|nr:terminase small subunit [bacterium]
MEKKKNQQRKPRQTMIHANPNQDGKLTAIEQQFITNYIQVGNASEAVRMIPQFKGKTPHIVSETAGSFLKRPAVKEEINRIMEEIKKESVATADEVMQFFTAVMRGEVKDQFGLDATLSDRTRAAQEIAKRTVDIENRNAGTPDQTISITLDWARNED